MSDCIGQTCGSPFAYAIFSFHPGYFRPKYVKKKKEKLCAKNLENLKNIPGVTKPGSSGNQALHLRST